MTYRLEVITINAVADRLPCCCRAFVVQLSCVLIVDKGSRQNRFMYDTWDSMDIVNTKVFNTPSCELYYRHDHPLISALIVEVGRV